MTIVLETERLRLRELVEDDLDFVARMMSDPEVMRFYPKTLDRDESARWLARQRQRYAEHGHGLWLVEDRVSGDPMGQVGLLLQDVDGRQEPEIGYLVHRPYWRRHFASEAALGVRDHAFRRLGLDRVISLVRPENTPSQGVARRLGMTVEREAMFKGIRHLVFSVSRPTDAHGTTAV